MLQAVFLFISLLVPSRVLAIPLDEVQQAARDARISTVRDFPTLLLTVVGIVLQFVGGVAVLFIVIGGFQYIMARGNEEAMEKAKKTVWGATLGFVCALLAYTIVQGTRNLLVK